MRLVRYNVAASLDGFIADAEGRYDWIPNDPTVDFEGLFARVDTVLLGRRTYESMQGQYGPGFKSGTRIYLFSRTLHAGDHPGVTLVSDAAAATVEALRSESGSKEIWLFGGGSLFASLLADGQVDRVEVTVVPVLLGGGTPLLRGGSERANLKLIHTHVYPSGMVSLQYDVTHRAQ
jgi:dihydrofolate reductase